MYLVLLFFFNAPSTTYIYTLSLHDALPILHAYRKRASRTRVHGIDILLSSEGCFHNPGLVHILGSVRTLRFVDILDLADNLRSEEHTSELQSRRDLVCRLLLEKKKKNKTNY